MIDFEHDPEPEVFHGAPPDWQALWPEDVDDAIETRLEIERVTREATTLSAIEQLVLALRFGIGTAYPLTLEQTARVLTAFGKKVSKEVVRSTEGAALAYIRRGLRHGEPESQADVARWQDERWRAGRCWCRACWAYGRRGSRTRHV